MTKTVYVSKSNACDFNKVIRVKQMLSEAGINVVEWTGGQYDPSLITNSNGVVVIGPRMTDFYEERSVILGKGQFKEIQMVKPTFVCNNGFEKEDSIELSFCEPHEFILMDEGNYQRTGTVTFKQKDYTMAEVIKAIEEFDPLADIRPELPN